MNTEETDIQAEYDLTHATRGAIVPTTENKIQLTIRLDSEVVEWFRSQVEQVEGGNYQDLINLALHEYVVRNQTESLETTLRRIIREEMRVGS